MKTPTPEAIRIAATALAVACVIAALVSGARVKCAVARAHLLKHDLESDDWFLGQQW